MRAPPSMRAFARAEALEEAAAHLTLEWTDSATERSEGRIIGSQLRKRAAIWRAKGQALMDFKTSALGTVNSTPPEEGK